MRRLNIVNGYADTQLFLFGVWTTYSDYFYMYDNVANNIISTFYMWQFILVNQVTLEEIFFKTTLDN